MILFTLALDGALLAEQACRRLFGGHELLPIRLPISVSIANAASRRLERLPKRCGYSSFTAVP